jgi:hypothetical protein
LPETVPKTFRITYNAIDENGNEALTVVRDVQVDDTLAPTIHLLGPNEQDVEGGTAYDELFATADDLYDGDVTNRIRRQVIRRSTRPGSCFKTTGCDPAKVNIIDPLAPAGTIWRLTYAVRDERRNEAINSRVDRIVRIVDTRKPWLVLNGDSPYLQEGATPWIDPMATAYDALEGDDLNGFSFGGRDLPSRVTTQGNVDPSQPAFTTFNVTYNVQDSADNQADPIFRTVMIVDQTPPTIGITGMLTHCL